MTSALQSCQNVLVVNQNGWRGESKDDRWIWLSRKTNWLCCTSVCLISICMTKMTLCCFFYKDVLSQALSEDAAWDFLIISKNDFYSIFTILIFYNTFSFSMMCGGLGSWIKELLPNQDLFSNKLLYVRSYFISKPIFSNLFVFV